MRPLLRPLHVQAVYQQLHARGLSSRTIRYTHAVLHAALEQAVRWNMLSANPSAGVQLPRSAHREIQVLAVDEVRRLLRHGFQTRYGLVFALAVTTGLRPSEYLALHWGDIDWQRGTVHVTRTLEKGSARIFSETKRSGSRRLVRLQSWVLELLARIHAQQQPFPSELIFLNVFRRPINSDYLGGSSKPFSISSDYQN